LAICTADKDNNGGGAPIVKGKWQGDTANPAVAAKAAAAVLPPVVPLLVILFVVILVIIGISVNVSIVGSWLI
jgi:hypothetical protein